MSYRPLIVAEKICVAFLLIEIMGLISQPRKRKSTKMLAITDGSLIFALIADFIFYTCNGVEPFSIKLPILCCTSYILTTLVQVMFMHYCKAFIEERMEIAKWRVNIPIYVSTVTLILVLYYCLTGQAFGVENGQVVLTKTVPALLFISYPISTLYLAFEGIKYRKKLGTVNTLIICSYIGAPFAALIGIATTGTNIYSLVVMTLLLSINQVFIQNNRTLENEQRQHLLENHKHELEEVNEKLNEQFLIVKSMVKVYYVSYIIDMKTRVFSEISGIEAVRSIIGVQGDAEEALNDFCSLMVASRSGEALRKFVDISDIDERLKYKKFVTFDFVGKTMGWSQLYIIAGDREKNGKLKSIFIAARTIHEEKEREAAHHLQLEEAINKAEVANEAKTNFLFNMSHDIRTPMNAIVGYSQLIKNEVNNPEKILDYQEKLQQSSEFLLSLINNVLDMARIESGKAELNEEYVCLTDLLQEMANVFEPSIKAKKLSVSSRYTVEHEHILCDSVKLNEIFNNLIGNAIKYTPEGGKICLSATELPSDREGYVKVQYVVEDNGIGMSEEFLPKIFDSFTREKNTTSAKVGGTGLGMAIVKGLTDMMGGTIEVESLLAIGTKFTLTFYHKQADKRYYTRVETEPKEVDIEKFKGRRILLTEDNELNAEIAQTILEDVGFLVEHAEDGVCCIDMLTNHPAGYYDLILMDVQMPNLNGYMATEKIRKLPDEILSRVPIIAMTANAFEEDRQNALAAGMNGHLAKPVDVEKLFKAISEFI